MRSEPAELRPKVHRIEFFSDAVYAVIITIMVLELHIPDVLASRHDGEALAHIGPQLIIYALSFALIGIYWANHHFIVFTLPHADRATLWLNNHALFWTSLIPLAARFFGEHPTAPRAVATYGFVLMMCTASLGLLRLHALKVSSDELHRAIHGRVLRMALIAIGIWAVSIPLAFIDVRIAWLLFLIVPAMFFLPVVRRPMEWLSFRRSEQGALVHEPGSDQ